ncbi:2-hydroxyacyl-CoA dehydratase [uncultured Helicobacter sp.]|uniref:2-hydroxyacyl-CoA dehydratase n=1 Tax=uncultured Helicobacter sp. TaxID=175537 RepID=UPI00263AB676|nr:2-hydroxyacyl-CoA dehydratase [uncultured Helicobacter sp.]
MTQKMTPHINSWQSPDTQSLIIKPENKRELKRVPFTAEMKETHTILVPMMLPIHFQLLVNILHLHGYKAELLHNDGKGVVDEGLRNVHNDTCYPALLVIGQMIDALKSGKWDLDKVALLITQTGGGCRASNYIYLLRKALNKAGFGNIPVISLNFSGLESNQGFSVTRPMLQNFLNAILYGDLLMHIANQTRAYEKNKGDTDAMVDKWVRRITTEGTNEGLKKYSVLKKDLKLILDDFASIPRDSKQKVRVGIVGEIYIKFSPLGNNNLEDFLLNEDCEVVIPGFLDFCLYCVNDTIVRNKMYGGTFVESLIYRVVYWFFANKQLDMIKIIKKHGVFRAPAPFKHTKKLADGYVSQAMSMGEGWLLTAEMLELIEQGVENIVCTQPFGCLPNHIVGRGMMKVIKEGNPQSNIVSIDYDPGATKVNQENRIKLMLSNAKKAYLANA